MEPIVFINIGWMKQYQGPSPTDALLPGNFGYFKTNRSRIPMGHEQWNFVDKDGMVYGYVPRSAGINITRLGAARGDEEIDGVLVVFMARDPLVRQLKVVGWYRNATVRREASFKRRFGQYLIEAPIAARAADAHVLPVANRSITIPTAQKVVGGVGQSPVWYADGHPAIVDVVRRLVAGGLPRTRSRKSKLPKGGSPRNLDPATRIAVEKVAMELAMDYFDDSEDVSRACKGWDIEATAGGATIYVEVKGLSGDTVNVELTPNEYDKMHKEQHRYYVFIVTKALSKAPHIRIFRPGPVSKGVPKPAWTSDLGEILDIEPRTGARATLE